MQKQGGIVAWAVDDTGQVKKGTHSVGVATILWTGGQTGELSGSGEFVRKHGSSESAHRLASLLTGSVDSGQEAEKSYTGAVGNLFSHQAGDCTGTNSQSRAARDPHRSGARRCWLWQRHGVP
jgi:hypothetical protein